MQLDKYFMKFKQCLKVKVKKDIFISNKYQGKSNYQNPTSCFCSFFINVITKYDFIIIIINF